MSRAKSKPTTPRAATNADPIFAAIAAHEAACRAVTAAGKIHSTIPIDVIEAQGEAANNLLRTAPTTLEGLRALGAHVLGGATWGALESASEDQDFPFRPVFEMLANLQLAGASGPPDTGKAADLIGEIETDNLTVRNMASAIAVIAEGMSDADRHSSALWGIANGIEAAVDRAEAKRGAAWKMMLDCDK